MIFQNVGPHDKITNITTKETAKECSKTHESVSKDRIYPVDATVVRIMKARKTIDHRDLMMQERLLIIET
ncbi:hypothetical protein ACHAWX_005387 [Stephanocyclus meneghinianus]